MTQAVPTSTVNFLPPPPPFDLQRDRTMLREFEKKLRRMYPRLDVQVRHSGPFGEAVTIYAQRDRENALDSWFGRYDNLAEAEADAPTWLLGIYNYRGEQ